MLENMLGSFTNVPIGLMVGIGGGSPSKKNNVMLGYLFSRPTTYRRRVTTTPDLSNQVSNVFYL